MDHPTKTLTTNGKQVVTAPQGRLEKIPEIG
jgi:hypothetical protein